MKSTFYGMTRSQVSTSAANRADAIGYDRLPTEHGCATCGHRSKRIRNSICTLHTIRIHLDGSCKNVLTVDQK